MKATLTKLSLCPCGFPVLKDAIPLGAEYEVEVPRFGLGHSMICGGCGKHFPIEVVWVNERGNANAGYLPRDIFTLQP